MSEPVEIHVLDRAVRLLQPARGFRTSLDSVMLAAACPAGPGDGVLDMGAGVGGASFCLLHRVPECYVTGIEIQDEYARLGRENIALNNGQGRIEFIQGDIRLYSAAERFDHVICNPPYLEAGTYTPSETAGRAAALGHLDEDISVSDWIKKGFEALKPGGSLTMIHRADMTDKIILGLGKKFGAVEIIPLWPRMGEDAKRVIIRARKDRKTPASLRAGLVLHEADGSYTAAADMILRRAGALS